MEIILASASPRREQLLREMGLRFRVITPTSIEELTTGFTPAVLAMENAKRKAAAVAGRHPSALVIGADTVVVRAGTLFGKPRDLADAHRMLRELTGHRHDVITGVCLIHRPFDLELIFHDTTGVWMRPLTAAQITDYLARIQPLDKAGAYAIQDHGDAIIERIEGSYHNVMGLPVERLRASLEKLGLVTARD
jgi:septum formation protein